MVPDKFNMVDMGGIDLIESQGIAVEGLYQRLVESIALCRYQCLYNWKFNGILIPPSYVEMGVRADGVWINEGVAVDENDVVHIYSIEPEPPTPIEPEIEPLTVTENGVYNVPTGVDGFNPVTVNVPISSAGIWRDSFSVNWDFSNPVNTRGQAQYRSSTLIYTLDGWQLQDGQLDIVSGGIKLSRYTSDNSGYFMQRYKSIPTGAFVGKQMIMTAIVDGVLNSFTTTMTAGAGGKGAMTLNGITFRFYNYGTEVALTIDIDNGNEDKIIQAVKFETGSEQTLATLVNGIWVLNQQMDADTELVKIGTGLVYNA